MALAGHIGTGALKDIGTDRGLLLGHDALLSRQMARDLLHALSHKHDNTRMIFGEPVIITGGDKPIPW